MQRLIAAILLILLLALPVAAAGARADIEKLAQQFSAAAGKGDADALAAMYADDAQMFPPNAEAVSGRENIRALWQSFVDQGMKGLQFEIVGVERHGNVIVETGKYVLTGDAGKELDRGKYVVVWKRSGKSWQLYRDIWNSSLPAPAPAK